MIDGRLLQDMKLRCIVCCAFYSGSLKVDNPNIKNCVAKWFFQLIMVTAIMTVHRNLVKMKKMTGIVCSSLNVVGRLHNM
jgi:hypothetical protein